MKKLNAHKEVLYLLSLILAALAIAMFGVANLGISVYNIPSLALHDAISNALPNIEWVKTVFGSQAFSELIIQSIIFIAFCILIRKFRPFFLFAFVSTFLFSILLFGFQSIPAFSLNIVHDYPLALRIVLLILGIITLSISVVCSLKGYLYPPTVTFVQKGVIEHFKIKKEWLLFLGFDIAFAVLSIFIMPAVYHDWMFWEHGLSYGTLVTVLFSGPIIGLFVRLFDKCFKTKTLLPKWEKAFEIENKKGY